MFYEFRRFKYTYLLSNFKFETSIILMTNRQKQFWVTYTWQPKLEILYKLARYFRLKLKDNLLWFFHKPASWALWASPEYWGWIEKQDSPEQRSASGNQNWPGCCREDHLSRELWAVETSDTIEWLCWNKWQKYWFYLFCRRVIDAQSL